MLKKCWKSGWLLASLMSLAFLLASGSNALQSLEHKADDGDAADTAQRDAMDKIATIAIDDQQSPANMVFFLESKIHPDLAYIHQITDITTQPNVFSFVPELAQLNTITPIALIGAFTATIVHVFNKCIGRKV